MVIMGGKGSDTNKHNNITVTLDDIGMRQFKQIKQHYGFKYNTDVLNALIKNAHLNINIKE